MNAHTVKAGRMKTMIGFDDKEMFWGDDGKFAPMSYWLSRDLLTGATYAFDNSFVNISGGVFSGGNPTKGYGNYLDMVEDPNTKSNNTPILGGKIELKYDNLFDNKNYGGYIFTSYLKQTTGSTWNTEIGDGKRNADVAAHGIIFKAKFDDSFINRLKLFAQYTQYTSGLTTRSSQSDRVQPKRFKNIAQKGFFVGAQTFLMENKLSLGAAFEMFSRYDYNIFAIDDFVVDPNKKNKKQKSFIFDVQYFIKPYVSVGGAYHSIKNPFKKYSNIIYRKKDNRFKIYMHINI
jgi:hypothetical protein